MAAGGDGGALGCGLSMERVRALTELSELEAAYSRLCEEEVRAGPCEALRWRLSTAG